MARTGTTVETYGLFLILSSSASPRSRGGPLFSVSVSKPEGSGSAASTWIAAAGPPWLSWLTMRLSAPPEMLSSASG